VAAPLSANVDSLIERDHCRLVQTKSSIVSSSVAQGSDVPVAKWVVYDCRIT
jgi:hypothetical protein